MELRDIEYFGVVAEHRHLGRAAEALGLSTSALSKCLRRLEEALETKLVRRTTRGLELTPEGEALNTHACKLKVSLADAAREVQALGQGRVGHLRIGTNGGTVENLAAAAITVLLHGATRVMCSVTVGDSNVIVPALRRGELDIMIGAIPEVPYEDIELNHLYDDDFVVVAARNHPLAKRSWIALADLAGEQWALTSAHSIYWRNLKAVFESQGLAPPHVAMVTTAMHMRLRVVSSTRLLGFVSRPLLQDAASNCGLVELPFTETLWRRRLAVGWRKDAYLSPVARRFVEILKTQAPKFAGRIDGNAPQ